MRRSSTVSKPDIPEDIVYDTALNLKPYTCASLRAALLGSPCANLAHYGRMLLPGVSLRGLEKPQRVNRLIDAVQEFKHGLAGNTHKQPIVSTKDFAACGTKKNVLFSRTLGQRIVCAMDAAYVRNKLAVDAAYARARNGKTCKVPAAYGSGDGNDCARGFSEKDGCCFAKLFRTEESAKLLEAIERDPDMSAEQKAVYANFLAAPPLPEFDIAENAKGIAVAFIANTQAQLYSSLCEYFGQVMASSPEEWDACTDKHWYSWATDNVKWAASMAKNGISSVLRFLYMVLEKIGGVWLFRKGKFLIGKTWQVLSTQVQKLAAYIATHPAQARAMLEGFKLFRDSMTTKVAEMLDKAGVFGNVEEHYKNATVEQRKWFCEEADENAAAGNLIKTILYYSFGEHETDDVLNYLKSSGWFDPISWLRRLDFGTVTASAGIALGSVIPFVGPFFATFFSKIGQMLGNALQEVTTTVMYVQDVQECLFLIVEILDITPCLEKWGPIQLKYPNFWMFVYSLRQKRKMNFSTSTTNALVKSRDDLANTVSHAIQSARARNTGEAPVAEKEEKLSLCGYERKVIVQAKEEKQQRKRNEDAAYYKSLGHEPFQWPWS